jgi:cytochrome P450
MAKQIIPPKPRHRTDDVWFWKHLQMFKADIFMAQPPKLYRAWMAAMRLPRFWSFFVNDPQVLRTVLKERPDDFPKSEIISATLASLLGTGVFVSNGALWKHQRRIIDPAFEGGKLRHNFQSMLDAADDAVTRLKTSTDKVEVEEEASQIAADIIFRTLFSIPITDQIASDTFHSFRLYQRSQPLVNVGSLFAIKRLVPLFQRKATKNAAQDIRKHLTQLTSDRADALKRGDAPDDLASKIMTNVDPETGTSFSQDEMIDQVAIFFLAGHETSASALAWALYLLALDPETQERARLEIDAAATGTALSFKDLSRLEFTRDIFRETLRLYPPVPMMVRETTKPETFRQRAIRKGSQIVVSPWHLHRHERLWTDADVFDPTRWQAKETKKCAREAYMPFSTGARACPGAGFAMIEGVVLIYTILKSFKIELTDDAPPMPVAHLTVRSKDGIFLRFIPR